MRGYWIGSLFYYYDYQNRITYLLFQFIYNCRWMGGDIMKQCGFTYEELASYFTNLTTLDEADRFELARIINENNQSIKKYIDEKISPKNTNDLASHIMSDLRRRGR